MRRCDAQGGEMGGGVMLKRRVGGVMLVRWVGVWCW